MKTAVAILILLLAFGAFLYVHGQSSITVTPGGTLASCPAPAAGSKALIFCNVSGDSVNADGAYVSTNGQPYFRISSSATFNPTTINCTTASLSSGASGKLAASGCVIQ